MTSSTQIYPPGPTNWRQSLLDIQHSPTLFLLDLQRTYGNFVHYRHGPAHCYLINEPELIRDILVDHAEQMSRPPVTSRSLGRFLGHGLLTVSGAYHDRQRKAIQPLFTPTWIASYAQIMEVCATELMSTWQPEQVLDVGREMSALASKIIYRTLFGTDVDRLTNDVRAAIDTLQNYSGEMLRRTPKMSEADIEQAILHLDRSVVELIERCQRMGDTSDLLSRLMNGAPGSTEMSLSQIRDEVVTLIVAGQETSANALTWLFYLLAQNPAEEARLRTELSSSASDLADFSPHSSYAGWVIFEALRMYPPAWLIGRTPIEPYIIQGYTIQPGDSLVISPYVLHRTPEFFPNPERFWPERFQNMPSKYAFLPFGAGSHVCIGQSFAVQEIMITLKAILRTWRFELVNNRVVEVEPLVTLQHKSPIYMKLHKL